MKKFIKLFLIILITLCFDINVYAKCFKLPVGDEQIIIPDGWKGRCVYENSSGGGSLYTKNTDVKYMYIDFRYGFVNGNDGVNIDIDFIKNEEVDDALADERQPFAYLNHNGQSAPITFDVYNGNAYNSILSNNTNSFNINGLKFNGANQSQGQSAHFSGAHLATGADAFIYSSNITKGCPSYVSWVVDQYGELKFLFQNDSSVSISKNDSYGTYKLVKYNKYNEGGNDYVDIVTVGPTTDDTGLIVVPNDVDDGLSWAEYLPSKYKFGDPIDSNLAVDFFDYYPEALNKCENIEDSGLTGSEDPVLPGEEVTKTLSCPYYFEVFEDNGTCTKTDVDINYNLKYIKDQYPPYGLEFQSLTPSVSSYFSKITISSIDEEINKVKEAMNSNTTYEGDYLKFNGSDLLCSSKKVTMVRPHESTHPIIFGESRKSEYLSFYEGERFSESLLEESGKCTNTPSKPNNNTEIDWGDPIDVNCDGIIGKELLDFINKIFRWIQILAPIFVIIMGSVDFAGALLQDDKDALRKASSKFIKRLIIAVALFFIPIILSFILEVFNGITGAYSSTCGIGSK